MLLVTILALALAAYFYALYQRGIAQRRNMSAYIVYLLFKDDIRAIHSEKMAAFIRDQRADPVTLGARVHSAIGRMADDLALNGRSIPTSQQIIEIVQVAQTAG